MIKINRPLFLLLIFSGIMMITSCQRDQLLPKPSATGSTAQAALLSTRANIMNPLAGIPVVYPVQYAMTNTVAGQVWPGYVDGIATNAQFNGLAGVASDAAGNVYIADAGNHVIRKLTTSGTVSTFAGDGGYATKNGPRLSARFKEPIGVAVDAAGNVYVADAAGNQIRKIATDGTVSTLAGSDTAGFADGPGNRAKFNSPEGVSVDAAGVVYVADYNNNRIRRISTAGVVTQWCGQTTGGFKDDIGAYAMFNGPIGVAVAPTGVVYVADAKNHRIRKIASGVVTTLAGSGDANFADGTGAAAKFDFPIGVATDATGNVYVADALNNRIRMVTAAGVVTTLVGKFSGNFDSYDDMAQLSQPWGIVIDPHGIIYIGDRGNTEIRKVTYTPAVKTLAEIAQPTTVATGPDGSVYTMDSTSRIRKITPGGTTSFVAGNGQHGYQDGVGAQASFGSFTALTVAPDGTIYVADKYNHRIRKIVGNLVTTLAGNGLAKDVNDTGTRASIAYPLSITTDAAGNVYVGQDNYGTLRKITPAGVVSSVNSLDDNPTASGGHVTYTFASPTAIVLDAAGNKYIACPNFHTVYKYPADGSDRIELAGGRDFASGRPTYRLGSFYPHGLALDANGTLYVLDDQSNMVYTIASQTILTPVAGSSAGFSDAPDLQAKLLNPVAMAFSPSGIFYIADHNRIRMMSK